MKKNQLMSVVGMLAVGAFVTASGAHAQILAQEGFENFTGWHGLFGDGGTTAGNGPFIGSDAGDTAFSIVNDFQAIPAYYYSLAHTYPDNQYSQNAGFSTQSVDLNGVAVAFTFNLATDANINVAFQVGDNSHGDFGQRAVIYDIFAGSYNSADLSNAVLSPITSTFAPTDDTLPPTSYNSSDSTSIALSAGTYTLVLQSNEARGYGTYIDNVLVSQVAAAPEPSTYALMLAGGVLLFWVGRMKRQNS